MSTNPEVTPPPEDTPETLPIERPQVHFSGAHWFFTGIIRLSYRGWTRVAAFLFPEDSKAEHIAQSLHIPLPDKLDMTWITTHLAVGGRIHSEDIKVLAAAGVTHVVDTRSEHCDDAEALAKEHIELLHLPTDDTRPLTIEQMLQGSQWVQERMAKGGRVLIHCEHGVGRSVQLTCAVLIYDGMQAQDALQLVQQKRWQAAPNHRQVRRLREFESMVVALHSA
jgi:protein-tyrosine phosphatase